MQSFQYELFEPLRRRDLETVWARLNSQSRMPVSVTLTRNRVSMCSVAFGQDGRVRLRLHEAFLSAPEDVLDALARYVRSRQRRDWRLVADFARHITTTAERPVSRSSRRCDRVHDVQAIARAVNRRYFNGQVKCRVEWGRGRPRRRKATRSRSIRFGTWVPGLRIVRVHPLLDDVRVPGEFLAYIIFHEMLHAVVPPRYVRGCRCDHTPEFRRLERSFEQYAAMKSLAKPLLDILV